MTDRNTLKVYRVFYPKDFGGVVIYVPVYYAVIG